ncbi:ABC transporter substrate-binding protein [Roseomonas sp. CCTCC AB2023176]|uniref:ABC transporter substrate-binding protein n=1 Tax=Roseomonas sp. CCTCC AB2023176 TaxID=3342640 RepID=UPI0035D69F4F
MSLSTRRTLLGAAALLAAPSILSPGVRAQAARTARVTDIAGRTVDIPRGARRIVPGEGRLLHATVLMDRDRPFDRIAAWGNDLRLYDPDAFRRYGASFPAMARIPELGSSASGDFSVERVISLDADAVVFTTSSLRRMQETGAIDKLARAGIPSVFVDFREEMTKNTVPSLRLLGTLFDRDDAAQAYIAFYETELARVHDRVATLTDAQKPLVFIEQAAGYDPNECCRTWGNGYLGALVAEAGGRNWGSSRFPGAGGMVNPEAILTDDPDVIIGTGANWAETKPDVTSVLLGYDAKPDDVRRRLEALARRPVFANLRATRAGRFHSIYHQFYMSPYHVVALQAFAKWCHPDLFADLDPDATFRDLHARFLPIPFGGQFWATLEPARG